MSTVAVSQRAQTPLSVPLGHGGIQLASLPVHPAATTAGSAPHSPPWRSLFFFIRPPCRVR
ncbi:hypothetical protein B0T18DRAFT_416035 [Schizothecium vesticola]|uniref:Uncharacterized protein n=1 Tax=Schizothecium vesticola TaxID=314040 RepID=A0AA40K2W9_9PEZI|nr:hypothetical protein B0T18DRAFT_416035 [Schizothecium vesticola]